ncbi:MAG: hypothetical protein AB7F35_01580 [Acetobacteraceae bacterium]
MTNAELRGLLLDCLRLWDVRGRIGGEGDELTVDTAAGVFTVSPADPALRPVRWFLQTPERREAGRPPRAIPSIVALLSALRNALGGERGDRLRVGAAGG